MYFQLKVKFKHFNRQYWGKNANFEFRVKKYLICVNKIFAFSFQKQILSENKDDKFHEYQGWGDEIR